MKVPHEAEHADLLRGLVLGEDQPEGASFETLHRCAVCRAELAELALLREDLGRSAAEEREVLREAGALEDDGFGGEDVVAAFVAGRAATARRPRGRWLPFAAAAAVAAALVAILYVTRQGAEDGTGTDPFVLGPAEEGLAPTGAVPAFDVPFTWDLETDGWYELRVYPDDPGDPGADALSVSPRLDAMDPTEWRWPAEETARWPARIRWEVRAFDATGNVREAAETRAHRAPP